MRRTLLVLSFLLIAATAEARMKLQGYTNASATVTVYKTGTVTSATIYADAVSTSKSNPFTAAADGFFSFYVDNGSYDIQFSGAFTTYSWTDIRVAEAGVTSNVLTFGAKCDGATDDTAAIQRAIDVSTPNKVQLPTGTCKITDELLIDDHRITIEGNGPDVSYLLFAPTSSPKAAIRVDLPTATVISLTRLKGFSIHTADTTRTKIGIDIVDASETIVEDVAIGTQDAWYGGTSVSPFTGTGSIGIRLAGREFGTFRNVRSCGAIPIYIANNPNFASIDLDHHNFDGFYLEPHGDNPSVYVEDGANLTNIVFRTAAGSSAAQVSTGPTPPPSATRTTSPSATSARNNSAAPAICSTSPRAHPCAACASRTSSPAAARTTKASTCAASTRWCSMSSTTSARWSA